MSKVYDKQLSLTECARADAQKKGYSMDSFNEIRSKRKANRRPGRKTNVGDPSRGQSAKKGK